MFGSELIQSSLSNDKGDTVVEYPKQKDPFHKNELDQMFTFNEPELLDEIRNYIVSTYTQHYAQGKYQASDTIIGNILKYWKRYGKKEGHNRNDLLKIIHYAIMMLSLHDQSNQTR
jgi:hypothetical protein